MALCDVVWSRACAFLWCIIPKLGGVLRPVHYTLQSGCQASSGLLVVKGLAEASAWSFHVWVGKHFPYQRELQRAYTGFAPTTHLSLFLNFGH
jgi:hypothetical protein